ncbi:MULTISPECIES: shikimate dehydrogenase [Streptomyces]|uniref:shikimate dehydrogenase n=1 Tax=Streptomyces lycopersici TaxID=2974589 RepID=UPI0021D16227|nr:shikimate dehydrogenase [Streptomyces sp. NEAU-383]
MPRTYPAAARPTMYFIGVTTTKSSIMKVFPAWARELNLDAVIEGIDLPLDDTPEHYREVVDFIKHDPHSLGALVTTHKLNLYKAAHELFDGVGHETELLDEVSSVSKRGDQLWGHAMDPVTSGLALEAIVPDGYWSRTGGELLLLGAGGSSLALTLYLHNREAAGGDVPSRIVVTNRREARLREMRTVHERLGFAIPIDYRLAPEPSDNDAQLRTLSPGSVVVNATGLGKDRPGSPLTDAARFPADAIAWDFNYRGDLVFLDQARAQRDASGPSVVDGWPYFIHGWTRVIAEVFHIDIPTHGPVFERLSRIARDVTKEHA